LNLKTETLKCNFPDSVASIFLTEEIQDWETCPAVPPHVDILSRGYFILLGSALPKAPASAKILSTLTNTRHHRTKSMVALVMTFAAGLVDVVGVLTIYKLFTAHMTGTTVHLGEELVRGSWSSAAPAATILVAFFTASLIGRVLIEAGQRSRIRRIASVTLAIEAALLFLAAMIGSPSVTPAQAVTCSLALTCALLAMLAGAMGLQTASLTKIGPLTVHTTFVTGMVNKLAQVSSRWLFGMYDLHREPSASGDGQLRRDTLDHARQARFFFAIWMMYVTGAIFGTWFASVYKLKALFLACSILVLVIAVDQVRPLSIEEEREQVE
jgi:uncharacterized membrane protein YoaK (UPF0700 family)